MEMERNYTSMGETDPIIALRSNRRVSFDQDRGGTRGHDGNGGRRDIGHWGE